MESKIEAGDIVCLKNGSRYMVVEDDHRFRFVNLETGYTRQDGFRSITNAVSFFSLANPITHVVKKDTILQFIRGRVQ